MLVFLHKSCSQNVVEKSVELDGIRIWLISSLTMLSCLRYFVFTVAIPGRNSIPDGHTKAMPTSGSKQKAKQNKMKVYIGVYSQSKPTRQSLSHRAQVLSNLLSYLFVCKSVQTFSRPNSRSLCQPISTSIHSEEKKAVYTVISLYHCLYLLFRNKTVVERLKTIRASLLPV